MQGVQPNPRQQRPLLSVEPRQPGLKGVEQHEQAEADDEHAGRALARVGPQPRRERRSRKAAEEREHDREAQDEERHRQQPRPPGVAAARVTDHRRLFARQHQQVSGDERQHAGRRERDDAGGEGQRRGPPRSLRNRPADVREHSARPPIPSSVPGPTPVILPGTEPLGGPTRTASPRHLREGLGWAIVCSMLVNAFTSRACRGLPAGRAAGRVQSVGTPRSHRYTPRSNSIEDGK
jgi:hypothetical protein